MRSDANVWTLDSAVDEVVRLRLRLERLGEREARLHALVGAMRRNAPRYGSAVVMLRVANKLDSMLLPVQTFEPEPAKRFKARSEAVTVDAISPWTWERT